MACNILKSINVVPEKTGSQTMLINFMSLTRKYNVDAPPVPNVLKAMKRPGFTVDYLLKCAVLTHFLIQYEADQMDSLLEFVDYLKGKWEGLC